MRLNISGLFAVISLGLAAICPVLLNTALPTYFFFTSAFVLSVVAGLKGSRWWFILTGLLGVAVIIFGTFVVLVVGGSKVGA
jgi:hypothetical protein